VRKRGKWITVGTYIQRHENGRDNIDQIYKKEEETTTSPYTCWSCWGWFGFCDYAFEKKWSVKKFNESGFQARCW
jgi:hypothetical protein